MVTVTNIFKSVSSKSFAIDVASLAEEISNKQLKDVNFNPTTVNVTNVETILKVSNDNYEQLIVTVANEKVVVTVVGKNRWADLVAYGTKDSVQVVSTNDYDELVPNITLNGSTTIAIELGSAFIEPGYTATDTNDGNIATRVKVVITKGNSGVEKFQP